MKTNLKWRLSKLPTVDEVLNLIGSKLITQDEAKDILFSSETEEDRDKESLKAEVRFLRDLVEKLSKSNTMELFKVTWEGEIYLKGELLAKDDDLAAWCKIYYEQTMRG